MNMKDAYEEICRTIKAYTAKNEAGLYRIPTEHRRPLLLMGPPGIGKTAVVKQAAEASGVAFFSCAMTHHTRQSAIGLPVIRERSFRGTPYSITEYTMSEIVGDVLRIMEETGLEEGILFLDEINCVSETLLPSMLRLLQFKTFGSHRIPDGWILAAAGNPPGRGNPSAREPDIVTLDRVRLLSLEPDLDAWRPYALKKTIHGAILSYLSLRPEHFYILRRGKNGKEFVTPRGWEDLSETLETYESLSLPVNEQFVSQFLQCQEVSEGFSSYYRLFQTLAQTPGLENLTKMGKVPEKFPSLKDASADEKLSLAGYLVQNIHRQLTAWEERRLLSESLKYFLNGLDACRPDFSTLEEACLSLLAKRSVAFEKKKEFGLLSLQEERREQLFVSTIKTLASEAKLFCLVSSQGAFSGQPTGSAILAPSNRLGKAEPSAPPSQSAAFAVMQSQSEALRLQIEKEALRLEAVFRGVLAFVPRVLGDDLVSCLFFTELLEQAETKTFLSGRMKEIYARFLELT
ncbi:MAG: AAA domain-containing protein [Lachnospiraceae bacterium]|nr:AAA domain-containing protein [Lachnospiraceae bacterium]